MDKLIWTAGYVVLVTIVALLIGLVKREHFSARWLLIAIIVMALNDAALSSFYGLVPSLFPETSWNWQGKLFALILTFAIALHPKIGWQKTGLTLYQNSDSLRPALAVSSILILIIAAISLALPTEASDGETLAFQLTMPGLEEESFFRGLLLLLFNEAVRGRKMIFGASMGWGSVLTCVAFGLMHALGYSDAAFSFDPVSFAATGVPALILVWLRERTGSILIPVILHNLANSIPLLL